MATVSVRHVSIAIERPPELVYAFMSDPRNLPAWASGLAAGIRHVDGEWTADSPMGEVTITFAARNAFGVVDHDVSLPDGATVHNPLRVLPNGDGSEVVFTLFRLPGVTGENWNEDIEWVGRDLETLKRVLESQ